MVTLLDAQKSSAVDPVVNGTVGSTSVDGFIERYKYQEKANSFGRATLWLANSGNEFGDLANDWPDIVRGAEVVVDRGVRVQGQELTADLPTVWIETIMYKQFQGRPFLVLHCIDWAGRLRYFRYASEQTWSNTLVEDIVSSILSEVGLTLASGAWSTALQINFSVSDKKPLWSAVKELMAKVPEVLYSGLDKEIKFKVLDSSAAASYDYGYNPPPGSAKHPLLQGTSVSESTGRANSITVTGGDSLQFSGTAEDTDEITLLGYRRRLALTDRTLGSNQECLDKAEAELEVYLAKSSAGVAVATPNFTVEMYDIISSEPPIWGGVATPNGHVTRVVEWFNFLGKPFNQALTFGEVPNDAKLDFGPPGQVSDPDPPPVDDAVNTDNPPDDPADPPVIDEDSIDDGAITAEKIADSAVTNSKIADDAVDTDQIAADAVTSSKIAPGAVNSTALADNSVSNAKMQNDSVGSAEIQTGAVGSSEIAASAVDTSELAAGAVTAVKVDSGGASDGQVLTSDGAGNADWEDLPASSGEANTASNVGSGGVGLFKQKAGVDLEFRNINAAPSGSITVALDAGDDEVDIDVANGGIDTTELADGSVTSDKLDTDSVTQSKIIDGAVSSAKLASNSVSNAKMQNDSVGSAEIQTNAVGSSEIAANAVDTSELATDAVTTVKIDDEAVTSAKIGSGAEAAGKVLESDGAGGVSWETPVTGVTDHGALTGLGDDDHTQYHNDTRGDARYLQESNNLSDVGNAATSFSNIKQSASTTTTGVIEIATSAEVSAGVDTDRAVVPSTLSANYVGKGEAASVTQSMIVDGAVNSAKLATNSVSNAKMQNDSVGTAEIQSDAVTSAEIASGAVDTSELADDSVSAAKIAASVAGDGLVQAAGGELDVNVDDSTIEVVTNTVRVKDSGIVAAKLASNAVTNVKMANNSVDTAEIVGNAVTPAKLAAYNAKVYNSASSQTITTHTWTVVTFNSEHWDNGGFHSTVTNTGRLTVPSGAAGKYLIEGWVSWVASGGHDYSIAVLLNGSTQISQHDGYGSSSTERVFSIATYYDLAVSDYVELRVRHDKGSNLNVVTRNFGCAFIGPP